MSSELSFKTAACIEYGKLLEECQGALKNWSEQRAEICQSRLSERQIDDELRRLQAKYARALWILQKHTHDCELCQLTSKISEVRSRIEGRDSENNSNTLSDSELYV